MMEHLSLVPYKGGSAGEGGGKYKECMRNHAAGMGGQAFDGCGEFMPDPSDSLKCAACGCHRSFHRRAAPVLFRPPPPPSHVAALQAFLPSAPPHLALPYHAVPPPAPWNVRGAGSETPPRPPDDSGRKRVRTKFTPEQKERMREFAETQGWRINRNDDGALERFCHEIGVRRQVLKVWMHNHKNSHSQKTHHLAASSPASAAGAPGSFAAGIIVNPATGTGGTGTVPGIGDDDDDDDDDDIDDSPPRAAVSSPSPSPISV